MVSRDLFGAFTRLSRKLYASSHIIFRERQVNSSENPPNSLEEFTTEMALTATGIAAAK